MGSFKIDLNAPKRHVPNKVMKEQYMKNHWTISKITLNGYFFIYKYELSLINNPC